MATIGVRVVILDDFKAFAELLACPFEKLGIPTLSDCLPIDFERLIQFCPSVIVLGMSRKKEALNRRIESEADLLGYQALAQLENYPALHVVPIIILGCGLAESDVPTRLNYDLFLTLAEELDLYVPKVRELGSKEKSRRKISRYVCPKCKGRLTYTAKEEDLFCPRCGTGVAIIEPGGACTYASPGGINQSCKVADLIPPKVEI